MKKYHSKKDVLSYLFILLPSLILIVIAIALGLQSHWIPAVILLIGGLINLSMWFFTYYQFQEGILWVRCGPFRWHIQVATIERVRESKNMAAGPALAMQRLEISHANGTALISPAKQNEFIAELQRLNPDVRIDMGVNTKS